MRDSFSTLLSLIGCRVETAADGIEGVRKALATRPDVAFIDIGLPHLDGMEVAKQIRESLGQRILLIACTAYDERYGAERSGRGHFDAWLVKPVEFQVVVQWLHRAATAAN